jgi:hypothetical protein
MSFLIYVVLPNQTPIFGRYSSSRHFRLLLQLFESLRRFAAWLSGINEVLWILLKIFILIGIEFNL